MIADPAAEVTGIPDAAPEPASAGWPLHRDKHDIRIYCRLACDTVDDLPLHSQRAHSHYREVDGAKHNSRQNIDGSGRLRVCRPGEVDRNVSFGGCILCIRCRRRATWSGLRRSAALSFRRSGADEILTGLKPEQTILAEIVRASGLHNVHYTLAFLIRIFQRFHGDVGEWFAVAIEDTAGYCPRRHELHGNVRELLSRG